MLDTESFSDEVQDTAREAQELSDSRIGQSRTYYPLKIKLEKKEKLTFYFDTFDQREQMLRKVLAE